MFNEIERIDRVVKPEPLKTHRDRGSHQGHARNEQTPATTDETEKADEADDAPSQHLLDIRI